jgi:hypothetical protein
MILLLYRLVEQKVILQVPAGYRDIFITGFVVCLGKCGSHSGRIFYLWTLNQCGYDIPLWIDEGY